MKNVRLIAGTILIVALAGCKQEAPRSAAAGTVIPDLMTTCPVSGDKLGGDMGKPVVIVYQGQEVKFCCADCKADFDKDPAKYIAKIRAADAPAKK
jgi:YHS domain-containing protein